MRTFIEHAYHKNMYPPNQSSTSLSTFPSLLVIKSSLRLGLNLTKHKKSPKKSRTKKGYPGNVAFSLILLLILVLLPSTPSHASESRKGNPHNKPYGTPDLPVVKYNPGKSIKHSYADVPYATTSLAYLFLKGQNAARAAVGLRPFTWDDNLAAYAQEWANQRVNDCALIHSGGPYGENIFWGSGDTDWSPEVAVDSWVVERRYYDYYSNSCIDGEDCGHYTQIIWKDTTRIGCAKVTCNGDLGVFITCNYDPPGNYIGARPY